MRKLRSVADLSDVLDVLEQPSALQVGAVEHATAANNPPSHQAAIMRDLKAKRSVSMLGTFEVPDLRAAAKDAVPVAAFRNDEGDVRRVYGTSDGTRIDVFQFGEKRMLRESVLSVSRIPGHVAAASESGAMLKERCQRAMLVVSAADTTPQMITALVHASKTDASTLKDALASRRADLVRRYGVGAMSACRKLATSRVLAQPLLLEDVLVDSSHAVGLHVVSSTRIAREELVAPAAVVMALHVAAQVSRVGGAEMSRAFLAGALEVGSEPAWRGRLLKTCGAFAQKAAHTEHPFSAEELAMVGALAVSAMDSARGLAVIEQHAPHMLQNIDT